MRVVGLAVLLTTLTATGVVTAPTTERGGVEFLDQVRHAPVPLR